MTFTWHTFGFLFAAGGFADNIQLLMPNIRRVAIIFTPVTGVPWNFSTKAMQSEIDAVLIQTTADSLFLKYKDVGDIVKTEWWGVAPGGGDRLSVTEVLYQ